MTFTFKLARRLAVSRHFGVFTALAVLVACTGETTAPDAEASAPFAFPASLKVFPRTVTVETDQPVRFRGHSRSQRGETVSVPLAWVATGGVIRTDGTFTSAVSGTFKVIGRGRGWKDADTSVVVVVPPVEDVARLTVTPDAVTLDPGATRAFTATGYLADGSTVTIGVNWTATGGEVDGAGFYTAGPTGGSFRLIASTTSGTLADTAIVAINAPPPPTPILTSVVVSPVSLALASGGTRRFDAYGRTSAGDSVVVAVAFSATGGTITSGGLYTAGASAGTFRVVASTSGLSDTAVVTLTAPTPTTTPTLAGGGLPFGPAGAWSGSSLEPNTGAFTLSKSAASAGTIVSQIGLARANGSKLVLGMTGGRHDNYLTDGVFDRAKWQAKMDTYDTPTIKAAVAAGVADGTIVGNSVMDEPNVSGAGDGNTWGPPGTMTKARVDSLCGYAKAMFPTLPVGVQHQHPVFEPAKSYRVCDFVVSQYSARFGSVDEFREGGLAMARRDGHAIMFALNILNGGVQDRDGTYDCTGTGQAGTGTYRPNCRMTAQQVRDWGIALGPAGCGLLMWRYDATFMSKSENQLSFRDVAARMAATPGKTCSR